jgi:hypothetical protein
MKVVSNLYKKLNESIQKVYFQFTVPEDQMEKISPKLDLSTIDYDYEIERVGNSNYRITFVPNSVNEIATAYGIDSIIKVMSPYFKGLNKKTIMKYINPKINKLPNR